MGRCGDLQTPSLLRRLKNDPNADVRNEFGNGIEEDSKPTILFITQLRHQLMACFNILL